MSLVKSSPRQRTPQEVQAHKELVARVGNGTHFTSENLPRLSYAERVQLLEVNPDHYRALQAGTAGGWHPTAGGNR